MSSSLSDPLATEDQFSGKLYWLNIPTNYSLDYDQLRTQIQNRTFYRDLGADFDFDEIYVPDIFIQDGEITKSIDIQDVELFRDRDESVLFGAVVLDEPYTINYRGNEVLILGTSEANFIIFQYNGRHYIEFLCAREVAEAVASVFKDEFDEVGSAVKGTHLTQNGIESLRRDLNAELMDTEFTDYPEPELASIRMRGLGFEEADEYDRQSSRGQIRNHMMRTNDWVVGEEKVLSVSRDGLIRSYSKVTLSHYLELLKSYVIPNIQREHDSSVLSVWTEESVYQERSTEQGPQSSG
jgi:hypothetical protein